jgi:hypothetical protein
MEMEAASLPTPGFTAPGILSRFGKPDEYAPIPTVAFADWKRYFASTWKQGEHVTILGHTGSGKTTIAFEILPIRQYVLLIASKPKDRLITEGRENGYHFARTWPIDFRIFPRNILWPKIERIEDLRGQQAVIGKCLHDVYTSGGWTLYLDEVRYLSQTLKLQKLLEVMWLQGRSNDISIVATSQRPRWIPLEAYQSADHLFMFRESDMSNLVRLKEIGGVDRDRLAYELQRIPKHDCIYVNTRDAAMYRFNVRR